MARLKRFELLTHGLEGRCSIQLSYRRIPEFALEVLFLRLADGAGDGSRTHATSLEGWDSTAELHPQSLSTLVHSIKVSKLCQTFSWSFPIFFGIFLRVRNFSSRLSTGKKAGRARRAFHASRFFLAALLRTGFCAFFCVLLTLALSASMRSMMSPGLSSFGLVTALPAILSAMSFLSFS